MSEGLHVVKMSGAGNDFIVLGPDEAARIAGCEAEWARRACRRGLSVGADGILLVERAADGRVRVRFHNPDGSPAFCGNGSRCAARFAHSRGWVGDRMILDTVAGDVAAEILGERVELTMPAPIDCGPATVELEDRNLSGHRVRAGVPHFVVFIDGSERVSLERWGAAVHRDPLFAPAGTNLDLVLPADDGALTLRTWERGVDRETLACGSGAIAAAFAARAAVDDERIRVVPASGVPLEVAFPGPREAPISAVLVGDARFVFEGRLHDEALSGFPPG
jgi:diaminopimelate epimerase